MITKSKNSILQYKSIKNGLVMMKISENQANMLKKQEDE